MTTTTYGPRLPPDLCLGAVCAGGPSFCWRFRETSTHAPSAQWSGSCAEVGRPMKRPSAEEI